MKRLFLLSLLLVLSLFFQSCQQEPELPQEPEAEKIEYPDQESWDSVFKVTNAGKLVAVIEYGHMERYNKKKRTLFDKNIDIDFYDSDGQKRSNLIANGGELDNRTQDVKAFGHVVVKSDTGVTLYTEELYFDKQAEKIISNVDVMIITVQGDTIYGTGLVSDPQLINYRVTRIRGNAHKGLDLSPEAFDSHSRVNPDTAIIDTAIEDSASIDTVTAAWDSL